MRRGDDFAQTRFCGSGIVSHAVLSLACHHRACRMDVHRRDQWLSLHLDRVCAVGSRRRRVPHPFVSGTSMAIQTSVNKIWDVAVVGEIFADHVFSGFERWPQPGEEHFTDHYVREAGGGAAITACALGKLGRRVALFAVMGEEDGWLQERLSAFGVDLEGLRLAPEP